MKATDIRDAQKDGTVVAVRVPRDPRHPREGRVVVPAVIEDRMDGKAFVRTEDSVIPHGRSSTTRPGGDEQVRFADVLGTWASYRFDLDHAEAIRMDGLRDQRIAYDLARKLYQERVARFAEAFRGLTLDQRALGVSTNVEGPLPVDLCEWLIESYDEPGSGRMVRSEAFEAVAERIFALTALAQQGSMVAGDPDHAGYGIPEGWVAEPTPEASVAWPEGARACSEPICDLPAVEAGENLYRCERGHLTIAPTDTVSG